MPICYVKACTPRMREAATELIMHTFPKEKDRIASWLRAIGQEIENMEELVAKIFLSKTNAYRVCSCHFTPGDYIFNPKTGKRRLTPVAVPTVFPERDGVDDRQNSSRKRKRLADDWETSCQLSAGDTCPTCKKTIPNTTQDKSIQVDSTGDIWNQETSKTEAIQCPRLVDPKKRPAKKKPKRPQKLFGPRSYGYRAKYRLEKSKMPKCIVGYCHNYAGMRRNYSNVILHGFPTTLDGIRTWLRSLERGGHVFHNLEEIAAKIHEGKRHNSYRVCSEHFSKQCYVTVGEKKVLNKNAVPTIFMPRVIQDKEFTRRRINDGQKPPKAKMLCKENAKPAQRGNNLTEMLLNVTIKILCLLTGEDYLLMKKTPRPQTDPHSHSQVHDRNKEKILDLTNQIIKLLRGEVPIRCQDVAVYFSMEEWEYVEGHKDLYQDIIMMEDQRPCISSGLPCDKASLPGVCINCSKQDKSIYSGQKSPCHEMCKIEPAKNVLGSTNSRDKIENLEHNGSYSDVSTFIKEEPVSDDGGDITNSCGNTEQYVCMAERVTSEGDVPPDVNQSTRAGGDQHCPSTPSDTYTYTQHTPNNPTIHREVECTAQKRMYTPESISANTCNIPEDHTQYTATCLMVEPLDGVQYRTTLIMVEPEDNAQYTSTHTTVEPLGHGQYTSTHIKVEPLDDTQYTSTHIKVEPEDNPQHTPTRTKVEPLGHGQYSTTHIKVEPLDDTQYTSTHIMVEPLGHEQYSTSHTMVEPEDHTQYSTTRIKVEPEDHTQYTTTCTKVEPLDHGQCTSTRIKVEPLDDTQYITTCIKVEPDGHTQYRTTHIKVEPDDHTQYTSTRIMVEPLDDTQYTSTRIIVEPLDDTQYQTPCIKVEPDDHTQYTYLQQHPYPPITEACDRADATNTSVPTDPIQQYPSIHIKEEPVSLVERDVLNVTSYRCIECSEVFTAKLDLICHQNIHKIEKLKCPECGKYFSNMSNLSNHIRSHTGEKPYSCPACAKRFTRKSTLIIHQRIHTGEKPFVCLECGRSFPGRGYLRKHQKVHKPKRPMTVRTLLHMPMTLIVDSNVAPLQIS
ncbi:uncharacterized protein LOC130335587 [Hyla sarda]|uniref:uncharacterized protein LOC130335587 n=1 Tax=Hyla sarda TaxID=327740 RepID=UPI0024C240FA|nr:uncharacterized protein LOC130335587 [Hyla sarda]